MLPQIEEIRDKLKDMNIAKVARSTGLSSYTIYKLLKNKNAEPSYMTMKKLIEYLESRK